MFVSIRRRISVAKCRKRPAVSSNLALWSALQFGQLAVARTAALCFQQRCMHYVQAAALPVNFKVYLNADMAAVITGSLVWLLSFHASFNISRNLTVFLHQPQLQFGHMPDN